MTDNAPAPDHLSQRLATLSPAKRALFERRRQTAAAAVPAGDIPRRNDPSPAPLSFAQQRLWILDRWQPGSAAYNIAAAFQVDGSLDVQVLERSLTEIVRRHEGLRTTFPAPEGMPLQVVQPGQAFTLPVLDLSTMPEAQRDAQTGRLAAAEMCRPFDLAVGPLLRVTLVRQELQRHVLVLVIHHIVSDGWSMSVLYRELSALYQAYAQGKPSPLAELPIQYADVALWQRGWLQGDRLARQLSYWRQQLAGLPTLELPTDHPRPAAQTFAGTLHLEPFSPSLTEALCALSRSAGTTLFITLLAAFQALLTRYTGQEDIVVGTPIANRTRAEMEGLIGCFVNMLVLRTDASGDPPFREFLGRTRGVALSAYSNQDIPFEKLVEDLHPRRDPSRTPLFQVVFVLQNAPREQPDLPGLRIRRLELGTPRLRFDLEVHMRETPAGLQGTFLANADLFDAPTLARLAAHYQTLLAGIVADPDQRLSQLPLLTLRERRQLLEEWNDTATDYPRTQTLHELFEAQATQSPHALALVLGATRLTYCELNARTNQLAHRLRALNVGPDTLVGLCTERSLERIVGILGILKAGGAYVPLEPSFPKDRLAFMLRDTAAPLLLTQRHLLPGLPTGPAQVVCLDDEATAGANCAAPPNQTSADHLAYVMYTSGSTGTPKGVCVTHRSVVRLVRQSNYVTIGTADVFLQFAPASFDASTFEIWASLLNGARLVIFPPDLPSLEELGQAIERNRVTILWLTASLFQQMVDGPVHSLGSVRQLLAGGDVLSATHARRLLQAQPRCRLINGYGPTENTTFTCCYPMTAQVPIDDPLPIGRPIANTQVFILDPHLQPVPVGVWGELHGGGDGLARGYLNRPDLTAEKFVRNPFCDDGAARLYKTGDVCRYRADGNIEFRGRRDHQVKVRGFRIELGEIETVLRQQEGILDAVVSVREHTTGDKRLVAFLIAAQGETVRPESLRQRLRDTLPDYMVPSAFVRLDAFPLSPNGKVNRNALPEPEDTVPAASDSAARSPVEEQIARIWANLLGVSRVGIHDNFFDLGGHSLLAIQLISLLQNEFHIDLPVRALFAAPTVAGVAARIGTALNGKRDGEPAQWSFLVPIQQGTQPPVFVLPGGGGGEQELLVCARLARHLGEEYTLYGLRARRAEGKGEPHACVEEMAADYLREIRSFRPHGPYHIIGECIGGIVAYEMARQLHAQGETAVSLIMMDTHRPSLPHYVRVTHSQSHRRIRELLQMHILSRITLHRQILGTLRGKDRLAYFLDKLTKSMRSTAHVLRRVRLARPAYWQRLLRYHTKPYAGRLTLILSHDEFAAKGALGWDNLAAGGIETFRVPGDHQSYIREHVEALATQLRACLETAMKGQ